MLFASLHPALIMIFADLYWYAKQKHNVDLTVTATVSTSRLDRMLKRVSKSHIEKRAIDIRTKDLSAFVVQDLCKYINTKQDYKKYHYMSKSGKRRLAYFHLGDPKNIHTQHIHLALHAQYAIKN